MSRIIDPSDTPEPDAPYYDPFDVSARQIALAIGSNEAVTIDEIEHLKQWCISEIQQQTME